MLMVEDDMEQQYLAQRFDEWSRAGVTRLWSGLSLMKISDLYNSSDLC